MTLPEPGTLQIVKAPTINALARIQQACGVRNLATERPSAADPARYLTGVYVRFAGETQSV